MLTDPDLVWMVRLALRRALAVGCCVTGAWLTMPISANPAWAATPWPAFRGGTGDGVSQEHNLPVEWSESRGVAWKTAIPGKAWSSPVIWDDLVWLSNATEDGTRLSKLPLEMLLIPGSSVAAAGVLADFGEYSLQAAGMAITQCILDNPNSDAQLEILGHAYTLAGMRFNRDTADSIFERQMTMLEQSSTVQHLLHRGRKEGREEGHLLGMLAGARKHFIETSTLFFGPVPEHCSLRVNTAQEADITRWTSRLRTAASWDELLGLDNISIQSLEMQDDRNRPLVD